MTEAELLRRAVATIRTEEGQGWVPDEVKSFYLAVADWLDYVARTHAPVRRHVGNVTHGGPAQYANLCSTCPASQAIRYPCDPAAYALAVARAYLGEEATP